MFYIQGNNIEMTRGDTLHAVINMRDPLGVISYPETGDVVTFNAMLTRDGEAVITKTIPHDTMTLTLDPEDTEELAYGRYIFTVKIVRAGGDVDTFIDDGTLTLVKTWRHKPHDAYVPWSPWIPLNSMNGWLAPGGAAPVDAALNISSTHPVQNRVLYQALAGKVDKVEGMGLSHNDFTDALAQKLADIENGATNVTVDALFVAGSTNPVQSKTIQAALAAKVDKEVGKGLSSNDYTSAEKEKLSGIEAGAQKNPDLSGYALKSEVHDLPAGGTTDQVLAKASNSDHDYKWVTPSGGGGMTVVTYGTSTSAEIEAAYQAGRTVFCERDGVLLPLSYRGSSTYHIFTGYDGLYLLMYICTNSNWSDDNRTTDDFYDADPIIYGVATSEDIEAALMARPVIFCAFDGGFYPLTKRTSATNHVFGGCSSSGVVTITCNNGTWSNNTEAFMPAVPLAQVGQILRYNGFGWSAHTPTKSDVGLANVDNTSDLSKPISTATQTALDAKITAPSSPTAGQFLVYNGTAWVAQTVPNANGVSF
jgi:hypothetical protein